MLSKARNKRQQFAAIAAGQSKRWVFCAFAAQNIAQNPHHFACLCAGRYKNN